MNYPLHLKKKFLTKIVDLQLECVIHFLDLKLIQFIKEKTFIESHLSYCPLVWMFCTRQMNRKINHIHERALRMVYDDYTSSFNELLKKDKAISIHQRNIHCVAIEMYKAKMIYPLYL